MKEYFDGAEADLLKRGQSLLGMIPSPPRREFYLLTQKCQDELTNLLNDLQKLKYLPPSIRLRKFQRIVTEMGFLETSGFAALNRATEDDTYLNKLVEKIVAEIHYPLVPPVVTSLSQEYFYIWPRINLLCVPLGEANALLHLPDLYHELAHPLTERMYEPRLKPFQGGLKQSLVLVQSYIDAEHDRERRGRGPESFRVYLDTWWKSWNESWIIEFFCDLFATYTLGLAYVWSHLHLCAKQGTQAFDVPRYTSSSHPADHARLMVMIHGLRFMGFATEAQIIEAKWKTFLAVANYEETPEYRRCYPETIIARIAEIGYVAVAKMGCMVAHASLNGTVGATLNEAWTTFWNDPTAYPDWETDAINRLRSMLV